MLTYQDWLAIGDSEEKKQDFIKKLIREHEGSEDYKTAKDAVEYDKRRNVTICNYRKWLIDAAGKYIPDDFTANYKLPSGFFPRFVTQLNQFQLGNGITLEHGENKQRLGKDFDVKMQKMGHTALVQGAAYGFWNLDRLEVFDVLEFAPLKDEENGEIRGGVRYWRLSTDKPLYITMYEEDGYSKYAEINSEFVVVQEKTAYITERRVENSGEVVSMSGKNYSRFPIIPMYANEYHQSEIVGIRESIDCYDLIKSGFANDVDEATMVYWIITNAGGMDAKDVADFVRQLKMLHAATVDGDSGVDVKPHTSEAPYQARQSYLEQLKRDLYEDFQVVNVNELANGEKTATEITAAYEPMNTKADMFEGEILKFLYQLFEMLGIDDNPTFTRSMIINELEETQKVLSAAQYLDDETILKKLRWITPDEVDSILENKEENDMARLAKNRTLSNAE